MLFELHFRFYVEIEAWLWCPSAKLLPTCAGGYCHKCAIY